jgi:hypothetical protein
MMLQDGSVKHPAPLSKLLLPEASVTTELVQYIDLVTPRSPTSYEIFPLPEEEEVRDGMIGDEVADKAAFQE